MTVYKFNGPLTVPLLPRGGLQRRRLPGRLADPGHLGDPLPGDPRRRAADGFQGHPLRGFRGRGGPAQGRPGTNGALQARGGRARPTPGAKPSLRDRASSTSSTCAISMRSRRPPSSTRPAAAERRRPGRHEPGSHRARLPRLHPVRAGQSRPDRPPRGALEQRLGRVLPRQRTPRLGDRSGPRQASGLCDAHRALRGPYRPRLQRLRRPASATSSRSPSATAPSASASRNQGCRFPGDFQGAASSVTQYNIWDEYLTQISGLTSCFLRPDLAEDATTTPRSRPCTRRTSGTWSAILYGSEADLREIFPGTPARGSDLDASLLPRPSHGQVLPQPRPGGVHVGCGGAQRGGDFALIADTRIQVGAKAGERLQLQGVPVRRGAQGRRHPHPGQLSGLLVDARKVSLRPPGSCPPYGIPSGCRFEQRRALPQDPELAQRRQAGGDRLPHQGSRRVLPRRWYPDRDPGRRYLRPGDAPGGGG